MITVDAFNELVDAGGKLFEIKGETNIILICLNVPSVFCNTFQSEDNYQEKIILLYQRKIIWLNFNLNIKYYLLVHPTE